MARTDEKHDDDDDAALFRAAVGPVRELPATPAPPERPRPRPRARMRERDEAQAREEFRLGRGDAFSIERGDVLSHRREQIPARTLKRLSQGLYAAQDELDLHHADAATAEVLLRRFILEARDAGHGCVRVVHGKGINSDDSLPVLKNVVDRILRQRADVLAFHSAPAAQGGTGAVLVLLDRR
ncbi:Smr/MutS family protein [Luteimonas sp. MJ250]|uniref:Smr/MutS family protein n=1 Tax=Luteimonas sp. MJ250 TaxID=3129236 RepID=UPI0031BB67AE